jgi:hypothetical protein
MATKITQLHDQIAAAAPIDGVAIGRWDDKTTWRVDYTPEATDEQKTAAQAVVTAFDWATPSVPASVHMWQAKAALQAAGKLDAATAAVTGSGNQAIMLAWEYAPEISRNSASVAAIGVAIGLAPADIDALFLAADAIVV